MILKTMTCRRHLITKMYPRISLDQQKRVLLSRNTQMKKMIKYRSEALLIIVQASNLTRMRMSLVKT